MIGKKGRAAFLPALLGALVGCQFVAGVEEDRPLRAQDEKSTGGQGSADATGGAAGAGEDKTGNGVPRCSAQPAKRASRASSGNVALAYGDGHYELAWPHYNDGVASSRLDENGILLGDDDRVLLPPSDEQNSSVALIPFGEHLLLGTSRRKQDASGSNTPMLLTIDDDTGEVLSTGAAPTFESDWYPEVASLVTSADRSRILMVLRGVGQLGSTDLRRFNASLTSVGEDAIPNTYDAAAAWSEELDRFGVFVLKQGDPKELWLHSFNTNGDIAGTTRTRINTTDETPIKSYFLHSLSATATQGRFFVAWTGAVSDGDERVYLTSVDQNGNRPENAMESTWVSEGHPDIAQGAPSLLFDGRHLVLTWRSESALYLRRFTTELEPYGDELEVSGGLTSDAEKPALVASEPGVYGVAYSNPFSSTYFVFQRIVCDDPP